MDLQAACALLESSSARHFASKQALIDACDRVADFITDHAPLGDLPRGYRHVKTCHWYAQQQLHSYILVSPLTAHEDDEVIEYAVNHTASRHCGDGWEDAPRRVLLRFAEDCAGGLLEEIAALNIAMAEENERGVSMLDGADELRSVYGAAVPA